MADAVAINVVHLKDVTAISIGHRGKKRIALVAVECIRLLIASEKVADILDRLRRRICCAANGASDPVQDIALDCVDDFSRNVFELQAGNKFGASRRRRPILIFHSKYASLQ